MSSIHLQTSRSISQEKALRKFLGDRSISPKMSQRVPRCARCVGVSRVSRGGCWGWGYIYRSLNMGYMGYIIHIILYNPYNPYIYIYIWLVVSIMSFIFRFIYGMSSFTLTFIFLKMVKTTNQIWDIWSTGG